MAMGSDGQHNGEWTVMDGAALWRWTARQQLEGEERRDGELTTMDDEERRKRAVGAIKANTSLHYKM